MQSWTRNAYLELLKRSVLNEIYLDDELRILYLRACIDGEDVFDYATLHDICSERAEMYESLKASRQIGRFVDRKIKKSGFNHTMIGRERLDSLHSCLDYIKANNIVGDFMECGVWRGGACIFMAGWLRANGLQDRCIFVADSFEGLPAPSHEKEQGLDLSKKKFPELAVKVETVQANFLAYDLLDDNIVFVKGWFKDTLEHTHTDQLALLRLDGDLYESTMDAMAAMYDRVTPGGIVVVDDYGVLDNCRRAVHDFFDFRGEPVPELVKIDWSGVYFYKPENNLQG